MSFLEQYRSGQVVLPVALLFQMKSLFATADDFVIWQFFYMQNTTAMADLAPSQIAEAIGKTVSEVNRSISSLTSQGLLDVKTIELSGDIEMIFDASPALGRLDELLISKKSSPASEIETADNGLKQLVSEFEREFGRLLSPFELEDLQQTLADDKASLELVREALKEAVLNGKANWKYIQAILRNWRKEGITTLRHIEERRLEREQAQQEPTSKVSDDFLAAMSIWE